MSVFKVIVLGILAGIAAAFILSNLPDKNFTINPIGQDEPVGESVATSATAPVLPNPLALNPAEPLAVIRQLANEPLAVSLPNPEPEILKQEELLKPEIKIDTEPTSQPQDITLEVPVAAIPSPPINEDEIKSAVARIRCGFTFGSGFVVKRGEKYYAITVAHVVINQIESKIFNCDVIFPRKDENGNFKETYYRKGIILSPAEVEKNYKEKAIDLAVLEIVPLENRQEDFQIFPQGYPLVNYPFCPSDNLGDNIMLLGYAANLGTTITPGAFLSKFDGEVVQYSDVKGAKSMPSTDFLSGFVYLPDQEPSFDTNTQHHIVIIVSNNNFSGASGGLVFDTSKNCIVGANFGTLLQNGNVFGFATNPNFGIINDWLEKVIK